MAEYIERETFLKDIEERYCLPCKEAGRDHNGCKCRACWVDDMRGDVIDAPAADVAPVQHGRWIMKKTSAGASYTVCSYCNASVKYNDEYGTVIMNLNGANYCPNCGAKMEGGDGNDDAE